MTHEGDGAQIRAVTMQTLLRELSIEVIDLLKVDIEGAEIELFDGCDWIDRLQALAVETHDRFRPGCSATVKNTMSEFEAFEQGELTMYSRRNVQQQVTA